MDKKIFIGPSDLEARVELIKLSMRDRPQKPVDWVRVGEQADFYTSAELTFVIDEAARVAFKDQRPITEEDILSVLGQNPPELNQSRVDKMKNPIGFLRED